jgi:hypothetical protein
LSSNKKECSGRGICQVNGDVSFCNCTKGRGQDCSLKKGISAGAAAAIGVGAAIGIAIGVCFAVVLFVGVICLITSTGMFGLMSLADYQNTIMSNSPIYEPPATAGTNSLYE